MKATFAVSALTPLWQPDIRDVFAVDPYIPHFIERSGLSTQYRIVTPPPSASPREDFERDRVFIDRKFHAYTALLAARLDVIHGTADGATFGVGFWRKAMALALLRHVTFCHEVFSACETHLDPATQECRPLDPACYRIPNDFDAHRWLFQHSEIGREQLFSVYCSLFHPGRFQFCKPDGLSGPASDLAPAHESPSPTLAARLLSLMRSPSQAIGKVMQAVFSRRSPRTALVECSLAPEWLSELQLRSQGRVQHRVLPAMSYSAGEPDWARRDRLCADEPGFDRFDRFVFACLRHGFPRLFVEDFSAGFERLDSYFSQMPDLRWIVCEWWIGRSWSAFAMAVARLRGINHLYNEHNYYAHPFVGNNLTYIFPLVDKYLTIGWEQKAIPNLVRGASLFDWTSSAGGQDEKHDLLFVSSIPNVYPPEFNSCYGESGARVVPGYLEMNRVFLGALDENTLRSIYFRAYPASVARECLVWDQGFALRDFIGKCKAFDDSDTSAKQLISQSRLVVINYLSTSYIESLVMDVPTVILWNRDAYFLEKEHEDFFRDFVDVGICQTDPRAAAAFVDRIKSDPDTWWQSVAVRRARANFLDANFGAPETMVNYLLGLQVHS